ncbi:MAG TPA: O-antigen ligase family protein [Candidatus Acidoferrales bacterium]|nr:O-antigen ligase family protein [Candidatus Acidoferrales bacterium]
MTPLEAMRGAKAQSVRVDSTATDWLPGYLSFLLTALIPALAKPEDPDAGSPLGQIVWSIAYLLAAYFLFKGGERAKTLLRQSPVIWAFVFLMLLSTAWSVEPDVTFKNAIELAGTTVVSMYFVLRYPLQRLLECAGLAFGTIAILSLVVVVFFPQHGRTLWGAGPWQGIYPEKNNLGKAMAFGVISMTIALFYGSRRRRFFAFGTLVLCLLMLLGSQSATALVASVAATALGLFFLLSKSPKFAMLAWGIAGALVISAVIAFLVVGFQPDASLLGRSSSLTGRTDFWPYLQQAISDRPILGYGYNAFFRSSVGTDYLSYYVVEAGGWSPYHAHDSVLQIGLDAGFVGIAMMIVLLVVALVRAVRYVSPARGVVSAWPLIIVLYIIFGSYTETYVGDYNSFEWIFLVAAMLYPARSKASAASAARPVPAMPR